MHKNLWNSWEVKPPPFCTTKQLLNRKEIINLKNVLFSILNTLKNVHLLNYEAAILSKMLYKNRRPFRHDKGIQNLVKIYQCLKRYLRLDFFETVNNFKATLPGVIKEEASHAYLPTKQMLQWVLLRLQAFAKLFARMADLSKAAGFHLHGKMCLGWALKSTLCFFAINSRIYAFSKFLLLKSIEWYNSLYAFLPALESTSDFFKDYEFPRDFKEWLGDVDVSPVRKKSDIDDVFDMIDLTMAEDESEVTVIQENLFKTLMKPVVVVDVESKNKISAEKIDEDEPKNMVLASQEVDIGVPVDEKPEEHYKIDRGKSRKNRRRKPYGKF